MRFFASLIVALTFLTYALACPPDDEEIAKVTTPLGKKFNEDICGQGIKPGGSADLKFVFNTIAPYYLNSKWLTKAPPSGWEKEKDKLVAKCHKNSYNYCDEATRKTVGDCVKNAAGGLMLKYGATAMSYCPIADNKIANFEKNEKAQVMKFFTMYCATKGKKC